MRAVVKGGCSPSAALALLPSGLALLAVCDVLLGGRIERVSVRAYQWEPSQANVVGKGKMCNEWASARAAGGVDCLWSSDAQQRAQAAPREMQAGPRDRDSPPPAQASPLQESHPREIANRIASKWAGSGAAAVTATLAPPMASIPLCKTSSRTKHPPVPSPRCHRGPSNSQKHPHSPHNQHNRRSPQPPKSLMCPPSPNSRMAATPTCGRTTCPRTSSKTAPRQSRTS